MNSTLNPTLGFLGLRGFGAQSCTLRVQALPVKRLMSRLITAQLGNTLNLYRIALRNSNSCYWVVLWSDRKHRQDNSYQQKATKLLNCVGWGCAKTGCTRKILKKCPNNSIYLCKIVTIHKTKLALTSISIITTGIIGIKNISDSPSDIPPLCGTMSVS